MGNIPIVRPGDVISLKKRYYFGVPEPDVVATVIYVNPVPINQDAVDRRYPMHYASTEERMNALRLRTNKYVWSTEVVDRSGMIVPVGRPSTMTMVTCSKWCNRRVLRGRIGS